MLSEENRKMQIIKLKVQEILRRIGEETAGMDKLLCAHEANALRDFLKESRLGQMYMDRYAGNHALFATLFPMYVNKITGNLFTYLEQTLSKDSDEFILSMYPIRDKSHPEYARVLVSCLYYKPETFARELIQFEQHHPGVFDSFNRDHGSNFVGDFWLILLNNLDLRTFELVLHHFDNDNNPTFRKTIKDIFKPAFESRRI